MLTSELQEGHKISLIVDRLDFDSELVFIREDYLLISLIVVEDRIVNFPNSIKTDMVYFDESDKLYIWENVSVIPVVAKDGTKYHKVNMPLEEGRRYNRRSNFRIYVGKEMRVDIKNAADRASIMPLIRDVSASGFSFVSEKEFEIGQRVSLFYESDGGKVVEFTGKIVRSLFNDSRKNFVYGCLLSDPIGIMRKFVNAQQQKQLSEKNTIPKRG